MLKENFKVTVFSFVMLLAFILIFESLSLVSTVLVCIWMPETFLTPSWDTSINLLQSGELIDSPVDVFAVAKIFRVVIPARFSIDFVMVNLSVDVVSGVFVSLFMVNW